MGFPGGTMVKNPSANTGDSRDGGSIPGSGRSSGVENGNPLQYSCLGNFHREEPDGLQAMVKSKLRITQNQFFIPKKSHLF